MNVVKKFPSEIPLIVFRHSVCLQILMFCPLLISLVHTLKYSLIVVGSANVYNFMGLGDFGRGHLGRGHYGRGHLGSGH